MEGVVRSVKVEGWGVLFCYMKQIKFCATSSHVACLHKVPVLNVALHRTVGISGSDVADVATKMAVAKVPSYLHF
jgi:hypothetical protein